MPRKTWASGSGKPRRPAPSSPVSARRSPSKPNSRDAPKPNPYSSGTLRTEEQLMRWMLLALLALAGPATASEDAPNPVDRYFDKVWKDAGIPSRPLADDYEFYRRLSLDVIGRLPKPDEIRAFIREPDRNRAIDALLVSDEAAEFF